MGPAGFGVVSQLFNFYLLFTSVIHLGTPVSITSEMSKLNSSENVEDKNKINSYYRFLSTNLFVFTSFFSILVIIFSDNISFFLVDDVNYYYFIIIAFLAAPFTVLYSITESFLRSFKMIDKIVKINVLTNIISTLFLIPLVIYLKYTGVSLYFLIYGILPFLFLFLVVKEFVINLFKKKNITLSKEDKRIIFKIGFISLLSSLLHQSIIIFIRKMIITTYGYDANGIYQSVLSISVNYFGLLYLFLTNYTLPKLASSSEHVITNNEINNNARFILLIMIPMMLLFYGFKDFSILLLFSKNFISARELLFPQFIGDFFRVGAALFGLWLIPRRRIKQIIIIDVIFNIVFLSVSYLFIVVYTMPLIYVSYAYMFAFMTHFIMYFLYTRFTLNFRFEKKVNKNLLISFSVVAISFFVSEYLKENGFIFIIILLIIWLVLVVEGTEIRKIKQLLQLKNIIKKTK